MKKSIRDSKYELLRITSMFMIVIWHILVHGKVLVNTSGTIEILLRILQAIIVIHVNSFILVTGYYQSKSKFKFSKLFSINNAAWFYRVVIIAILIPLNIIQIGNVEFLRNIIPIDLSFYWFVDLYLFLYCLSPFLNLLIDNMNKKTYQKFLGVTFLLFSIAPSFTKQQAYFSNYGYCLSTFILLYFIGAYFSHYSSDIWNYFKITSAKAKQLFFLAAFCLIFFVNYLMFFFGIQLLNYGPIPVEIGNTLSGMTYAYSNPLVIMGAVMYFLWFGCLDIKSRFINRVGSLTIGIYLIHDNPYIRQNIYKLFDFKPDLAITSYSIIPKVFIVAIIIFVGCAIIEWIRQEMFSFVSNLKISQKIKNSFNKYIQRYKN